MAKYNHMLDVAFTIVSEKEDWRDLTHMEMVEALERRIEELKQDPYVEAFGHCDTYEVPEDE